MASQAGTDDVQALVLNGLGETPSLGRFRPPEAGDGAVAIDVRIAALNPFDVVFSGGGHPAGVPEIPSVVGREGVGVDADGRRLYFDVAVPPFGSVAERTLVGESHLFELLPDVDDTTAVALGAAGISAWIPLAKRAAVTEADTVVILGATGGVGRLAVQIAANLGADRVIAVGRRREVLDRCLELGADAAVEIDAVDDLGEAIAGVSGGSVDVVLDLLWGEPAAAAVNVCSPGARFVQVGSSAGPTALIPANPWRTREVSILGYSTLNASYELKNEAYQALLQGAASGAIKVGAEAFPLAQADDAWQALVAGPTSKIVIEMGGEGNRGEESS